MSVARGEQVLVVEQGGARVAFPVGAVREVLPMLAVRPLPASPRHCLGSFVFRGELALAFDLALRLGLPASTRPAERRQLVLCDGLVAWAVDRALGLDEVQRGPPPLPAAAGAASHVVLGFAGEGERAVPVVAPRTLGSSARLTELRSLVEGAP